MRGQGGIRKHLRYMNGVQGIKILSSFTQPRVIPKVYDFLSYKEYFWKIVSTVLSI